MAGWQVPRGGPLMIVIGEVLLVCCSVSYLLWWTVTFKPSARTSYGGGLFLGGAVLAGLGGIVVLGLGVGALLTKASVPGLVTTVVGGVLVGALSIALTSRVAHRPLTTELPLIMVWGTAQVAAGVMLRTSGALSVAAVSAWMVVTAMATLVGLACYLVFYRLDPLSAYRVGMVPLAVDGLGAASLAVIVMVARTR